MSERAGYVIREMAFDDIAPIAEIEKENFSRAEVWSGTDLLTHHLREDALYLVAEAADGAESPPEEGDAEAENAEAENAEEAWADPVILGYAGVLMVPDESDITKVSVRKDHRRQGIAGALLRALQRELPPRGVRKIFLEVRRSNTAARGLYESCGFVQVGERKKYYSDPVEDALVMVWEEP